MKKNNKVRSLNEYKDKKVKNKKNENKDIRKKNKKVKNKRRPVLLLILLLILGYIIFFMYRYATISSLKYEEQSLNKELENIKNAKKELYLELETLSKSGFIEQKAKEKLHMDYPKDDQIVYIKLD